MSGHADLFRLKRTLAAECFRRIAEAFATAPAVGWQGAPYTPDDLLELLFRTVDKDDLFTEWVNVGGDETLLQCALCHSEAHAPSCPIYILDQLHTIGIDSAKVLPPNVGLDPAPDGSAAPETEMQAVTDMLSAAAEHGLEAEVVREAINIRTASPELTVAQACGGALVEWDV